MEVVAGIAPIPVRIALYGARISRMRGTGNMCPVTGTDAITGHVERAGCMHLDVHINASVIPALQPYVIRDQDIKISLFASTDVWYAFLIPAYLYMASACNKVWYCQFVIGAEQMNGTYAIIIDGYDGTVTERKLGDHNEGTQLKATVTIKSNTVKGNTRSIRINRALTIDDPDYYSFNETYNEHIPVIFAYGNTPNFAYHQNKSSAICNG